MRRAGHVVGPNLRARRGRVVAHRRLVVVEHGRVGHGEAVALLVGHERVHGRARRPEPQKLRAHVLVRHQVRHARRDHEAVHADARRPGVPWLLVHLADAHERHLVEVQRAVALVGVRDDPLGRERALAGDALKLGEADADTGPKVVRDALVGDVVHLVRERVQQKILHQAKRCTISRDCAAPDYVLLFLALFVLTSAKF